MKPPKLPTADRVESTRINPIGGDIGEDGRAGPAAGETGPVKIVPEADGVGVIPVVTVSEGEGAPKGVGVGVGVPIGEGLLNGVGDSTGEGVGVGVGCGSKKR